VSTSAASATVAFDAEAIAAIVAHAKQESPRECCGVLVGRASSILQAVAVRNVSEDQNRFVIDPAGHIAARRAARDASLQIVGFYHSHPHSPPTPSARDRTEASYDGYYAIAGLEGGQVTVRLYMCAAGRFVDAAFVTVPRSGRRAGS
jgi:proteasome lid subunit RPN8/RPN11